MENIHDLREHCAQTLRTICVNCLMRQNGLVLYQTAGGVGTSEIYSQCPHRRCPKRYNSASWRLGRLADLFTKPLPNANLPRTMVPPRFKRRDVSIAIISYPI